MEGPKNDLLDSFDLIFFELCPESNESISFFVLGLTNEIITNAKRQKQELGPDSVHEAEEEERARIHLRDKILAIALMKADKQVWGISHA